MDTSLYWSFIQFRICSNMIDFLHKSLLTYFCYHFGILLYPLCFDDLFASIYLRKRILIHDVILKTGSTLTNCQDSTKSSRLIMAQLAHFNCTQFDYILRWNRYVFPLCFLRSTSRGENQLTWSSIHCILTKWIHLYLLQIPIWITWMHH